MELLGDKGRGNLTSFCLETVLVRCEIGAWFASNVPKSRTSFWTHPMELLGDVGHVKSHFGLFGDSVGVGAI